MADFNTVILPHTAKLRAMARRYVRTADDVDDLVQETLLRAFRLFGSYQDGNPLGWLKAVMFSVFANRYTKEQNEERRREEFVRNQDLTFAFESDEDDRPVMTAVSDSPGADTAIDAARFVVKAFEALPDAYKPLAWLVYVEDMPLNTACERLGIPNGTGLSRMSRIRDKIRAHLESDV